MVAHKKENSHVFFGFFEGDRDCHVGPDGPPRNDNTTSPVIASAAKQSQLGFSWIPERVQHDRVDATDPLVVIPVSLAVIPAKAGIQVWLRVSQPMSRLASWDFRAHIVFGRGRNRLLDRPNV
jgi:hypothetical protein